MIHPADDPLFGTTVDENVWYLAHPLAADERFTFQQNMDHIVHIMRICYEEGWRVIAPYHTICLALDDSSSEHRRIGLEVDCVLAGLLGRILLCGHKLSVGMTCERDAVIRTPRNDVGIVYNFVGWNDNELREGLRLIRNGGVQASV